ncbi:MAG: hypothetical protein F7B20_02815 [Aeropyrum sp.]|nr:hypothetical protein [Aeropyrum sp.]MCE4615448.1 hypothetical protein [Aeropyrum sp.]
MSLMDIIEAIGLPAITGLILLPASYYGYRTYKSVGNTAVLALAVGLLFVSIQTFMEALINYLIISNPEFYGSNTHYILDAFRGTAIVVWSAAMASIFVETLGVETKWLRIGFPGIVFISGTVFTFSVNLLSGIEVPSQRLLISSIGRVLGQLVPLALMLGAYFVREIALPTGSRAASIIGLVFLLHGITLPLYSLAKSFGIFTLALWYAAGGIIPAVAAAYGFRLLYQEQAEVVESMEEAT